MNFTITESAAQAIKETLDRQDLLRYPQAGLRLGVIGGGCSGLQYLMDTDSVSHEDDNIVEAFGQRVFIDPKSATFLEGCILDWGGSLAWKGFKISKPDEERKTCGCGSSFVP